MFFDQPGALSVSFLGCHHHVDEWKKVASLFTHPSFLFLPVLLVFNFGERKRLAGGKKQWSLNLENSTASSGTSARIYCNPGSKVSTTGKSTNMTCMHRTCDG
ncbi:hypothetical protein TWF225_002053 [Orbilia oligospora]|nr:hypothetical protein TWF225_002053 [Orbilia oligospora]KAF3234047.1 hypothetical protein TWF128_002654 [Orbilia oligospora]KAF3236913.1 hypothetical protein TWF217_002448 [Orbilia oligospora]KAF3280738.1 hypothetical protein TWF132_011486 [Orbilia oligospora]